MRCECIITRAVAFCPQFQIALCEFEIGFDLPAQHVRFQDFPLGQGSVRAHETHPVLAVAAVPRIYKFCQDCVPFAACYGDIYRKPVIIRYPVRILWSLWSNTFPHRSVPFPPVRAYRESSNMRAHLCFLSVCDSRSRITPAAVSC